ncbi:MAG: DUF2231 domain-containing protein [Aquificae bacterium]|nr:DUF2231 domain-containing protein [Aquificota bacterium]
MGELHPPVVHFAIALSITGIVFEFLGRALSKKELTEAGFYTLLGGALFLWLAWFTGHSAEELVEEVVEKGPAYELLELHESIGNFLPFFFTFLVVLRSYIRVKDSVKLRNLFLLLGAAGIILVVVQGRLGGKLVYEYGVGVKISTTVEKEE